MMKCEFHIIFAYHKIFFFGFFSNNLKMYKPFLDHMPYKNRWRAGFGPRVMFAHPYPKVLQEAFT